MTQRLITFEQLQNICSHKEVTAECLRCYYETSFDLNKCNLEDCPVWRYLNTVQNKVFFKNF